MNAKKGQQNWELGMQHYAVTVNAVSFFRIFGRNVEIWDCWGSQHRVSKLKDYWESLILFIFALVKLNRCIYLHHYPRCTGISIKKFNKTPFEQWLSTREYMYYIDCYVSRWVRGIGRHVLGSLLGDGGVLTCLGCCSTQLRCTLKPMRQPNHT